MLPLSNGRIWLYTGNTDMRKQFDGLAALVQRKLGMQRIVVTGLCLSISAVLS